MPAAYAHYTFKKVLANTENSEIRRIITEHRALFDIGLHGCLIFVLLQTAKKHSGQQSRTPDARGDRCTFLPPGKTRYQPQQRQRSCDCLYSRIYLPLLS